jgi:hypothetical protein
MRYTLLLLFCLTLPVHAAGPGDENPQATWDWCMQEAIKAEVWSGIAASAAVKAAYKDCKPEYQTLLASSRNSAKVKSETEAGHAERISFAKKMKKRGKPQ